MKSSEFKKYFSRSDSFGHTDQIKSKRRKGLSIWMIFIAIIVGGLPTYLYLLLTGKMFELDFMEKFFNDSKPTAVYQPTTNPSPDNPWITNTPKTDHKQGQKKKVLPKQNGELIYSWIDEDGVKRFSNVQPTGHNKDLQIAKAYKSTTSKKLSRPSSLSYTDNAQETRVYIQNNQILVPVKFGNNGREVSTMLLLDTGATITSIHDDFADKLGHFDYRRSRAQIADGSSVYTKRTNFDYIVVGPFRINNFDTIVMDFKGRSKDSKGLLGMNFLKKVKYQIDYNRKIIKWL